MKKLLFSKNGAAPDAKTGREWMEEQGINAFTKEIQLENDGDQSKIIKSKDGRFFLIETSHGGIYEEIFEVGYQEVQAAVFAALNGFYS
jgi:hypothetical protein